MAMRASIIMGQGDGAAEELLVLVAHPLAPVSLCLKAMQVREVPCGAQLCRSLYMITSTAIYNVLAMVP